MGQGGSLQRAIIVVARRVRRTSVVSCWGRNIVNGFYALERVEVAIYYVSAEERNPKVESKVFRLWSRYIRSEFAEFDSRDRKVQI